MNKNLLFRIFDIFFSLTFIIFLSPLFFLTAFILYFTGEGEILYFQERIGYRKRTFRLVKFATMLKESPKLGSGPITVPGDPRVLPVGRILRKTKINELPQLFNILKGDMSFVGPRPLMKKQFEFYEQFAQDLVCQMRPGLTGAGSIFFRDEERFFKLGADNETIYKKIIAPSKALLEAWYFKNKSINLYFVLIIYTVFCVIFPKINFTRILDENTRKELDNVFSEFR